MHSNAAIDRVGWVKNGSKSRSTSLSNNRGDSRSAALRREGPRVLAVVAPVGVEHGDDDERDEVAKGDGMFVVAHQEVEEPAQRVAAGRLPRVHATAHHHDFFSPAGSAPAPAATDGEDVAAPVLHGAAQQVARHVGQPASLEVRQDHLLVGVGERIGVAKVKRLVGFVEDVDERQHVLVLLVLLLRLVVEDAPGVQPLPPGPRRAANRRAHAVAIQRLGLGEIDDVKEDFLVGFGVADAKVEPQAVPRSKVDVMETIFLFFVVSE